MLEAVPEDDSSSRTDTSRSDVSSVSFNGNQSLENNTTIASSIAAASLPQQRLNPKLTRRSRPLPPPRIEGDSSSEDGDEDDADDHSLGIDAAKEEMRALAAARALKANILQNPKRHLLHPGKYISKQYKIGRPVPLTGLWDCCGEESSTAMYCPSVESRGGVEKALKAQAEEQRRTEERAKYVKESVRDVWERDSSIGSAHNHKVETDQERALREASEHKSFFNIPMLIPYLFKKIDDEFSTEQGMGFLLEHCTHGDGCKLIIKHGGYECMLQIHERYRTRHPAIQLLVAKTIRRLLECNFTRDFIVRDTRVLKCTFFIGYSHMKSEEHVENSFYCVLQTARSAVCRYEILDSGLVPYLTILLKKYSRNTNIVRCMLRLFNWVGNTPETIEALVGLDTVETTIRCVQRHHRDGQVLSPAMLYLTRTAKYVPFALDLMLKMKAIPVIINALRALFHDEELQVEGLKMVKTLSMTSEGWKQITETRGGWQSLCQGTTLGDALVHELPGHFNNPGWCIGDTPYLPMTEKQKLAAMAASEAQSGSSVSEMKSTWTPLALKQYMGVSLKEQRLKINNLYHDTYFSVLSSLDLLPLPGEESVHWFKRLADYENLMDLKLEDMTNTVIDMKDKEELDAAERERELAEREYIKPVIVAGQVITTKLLAEKDLDLTEIF